MDKLLESRKKIDVIDNQIADLFIERIKICNDVAEYKLDNNKPVLDRKRELEKIEAIKKKAPEKFFEIGLTELFEQIMSMSRKMQYALMNQKGLTEDLGFEEIRHIPKSNVTVAYQGIAGAYSQQAASAYFEDDVKLVDVHSFRSAIEQVKKGAVDYAVLPFENSSAGIVTDVYDLLVEYDTYILDTFDIKIEHCLCALPEATMEDITEVYSHPQAFMQSNDFIEENGWDKYSLANTAVSAKFISEQTHKNRACICSEEAAKIYGLKVLKKGVNFTSKNTTKFIIVSNKKMTRHYADRICISFEMPHESGTLYQMLSHIIYNNLNMTGITSRPVPDKKWEYRFYVEFEGDLTSESVLNALNGIKQEAENLKILGSY